MDELSEKEEEPPARSALEGPLFLYIPLHGGPTVPLKTFSDLGLDAGDKDLSTVQGEALGEGNRSSKSEWNVHKVRKSEEEVQKYIRKFISEDCGCSLLS